MKQGISDGSGATSSIKQVKGAQEEPIDSITERINVIKKKKNLRSTKLESTFDTGLPDGQKPLKRVQVQALDMDWLFYGDNAKILLSLLATEANNQTLVKQSIKTFVDLMWSYYQPAIIKRIFMPYIIYLFIISQLAGRIVGQFILYRDYVEHLDETVYAPDLISVKSMTP